MLGREGLAERARLVIEKPFGLDLESFEELDHDVHEVFDEDQVFRIDHFLGKEAVQNLLALRFANALFEPAWDRRSIASVQVDVPETLAMEGRGSLLRVDRLRCATWSPPTCSRSSAAVALEDPGEWSAGAVRDARADGLRRPCARSTPHASCFGQYDGYRDEDDVDEDSDGRDLRGARGLGRQRPVARRPVPPAHRQGDGRDPPHGHAALPPARLDGLRRRPRARRARPRAHRRGAGARRRSSASGPVPRWSSRRPRCASTSARSCRDDEPLEAYERLLLDVLRRRPHPLRPRRRDATGCGRSASRCSTTAPTRCRTTRVVGTAGGARPAARRVAARPGREPMRAERPDGPAIADHGLVGDLRTAALVGDRRHHRLVLPRALRRPQRLRARSSTPTPARGGSGRTTRTRAASSTTTPRPTSSSPAS